MNPQRNSRVAFVLFRFKVDDEDSLLLLRHPKWGDWSLVGGHIEEGEQPIDAALRETEEELPPLRATADFGVSTVPFAMLGWGPVRSASAGGVPTTYSAWFFSGEFYRAPADALRAVDRTMLAAVPLRDLDPAHWPVGLTDVLARLASTPEGLAKLPLAWPESVSSTTLQPWKTGDHPARDPVLRRARA